MSSPPPGRALTFPIACEGNRQESAKSRQYVPSDEEAMARLQSSHSDALEILFARYSRLVLSVARGVVRDPGEAEDVVQEVFFYLYKKSNLFDGSKGSVKNWILQIALHRALDRKSHLARRGFYAGTELESLDDTLAGETDLDREIASKLDRRPWPAGNQRETERTSGKHAPSFLSSTGATAQKCIRSAPS
jgi:RNA polymerase sigma factor (sigma-70 family)